MTFDYIKEMSKGHSYNKHVAHVLQMNGISCSVPQLEIAQTQEDVTRMTENEKDIILRDGRCLEVKSRNLYFSEDPSSFPYNEIFVDTVSGFNAKKNKPLAYIFVSQKTKEMFALPTYTQPSWVIEKKFDRYRKHEDKFYKATLDMCRPFSSLINYLTSEGK